jgi:hypothetical protein
MKQDPQAGQIYVNHMLECIARVFEYSKGNEAVCEDGRAKELA